MILTALVVFCCSLPADKLSNPAPAVAARKVEDNVPLVEAAKTTKPDAPAPKAADYPADSLSKTGAETAAPSSGSFLRTPIKPASTESYETPRQRKIWYGLMATGHAAAAFDAWSTRQAVTSGSGVEANPLQRPFAGSGAIYATTQVCPALMDFVGRRMISSGHPWMRRIWWVPQAASASFSLGAGIHNYTVTH